jgi:hypothetical protein
MPQVSGKQNKIDKAKESAPNVPGYTCPIITTISDLIYDLLSVVN